MPRTAEIEKKKEPVRFLAVGQRIDPEDIPGPLDLVETMLFKDDDRYSDDVTVGYNGVMYKIQRGERVQIPYAVFEILQNSQIQDSFAARFMDRMEREYEKKENEILNN